MVEPKDALDQARSLTAGVAQRHRVDLPRDWRRRAIPSRSAKPSDVRMAVCPGGVWLDIAGRAGVLFRPDQWAQLALEAVAVLTELDPAEIDPGDMHTG